MSIQKRIDQHLEGFVEKSDQASDDGASMPIGTIVLEGQSGSFELPENVRLVLRDPGGSITCSGAGGNNELSIIGGDNVKVEGFKDGILRLEKCDKAGKIECSQGTILHVADTEIEDIDLTNSQATLSNCTIKKASFTKTDVRSNKNEFEDEVTIDGGTFTSDQDSFQGDTTITDAVASMAKPQLEGDLTIEKSVVTFGKASCQGEVTIEDSKFVDDEGEFQDQVTVSGDKGNVVFRKSSFQDQLEVSDSAMAAVGAEMQDQLTLNDCSANLVDCQVQDSVSLSNFRGTMKDCSFQKDFDASDSCVRLIGNTFQKDVTISEGSVESDDNEYSGDFTLEQGTILSVNDTFSKDMTLTEIKADNKIWKPGTIKNLEVKDGDNASLDICEATCQQVHIESIDKLLMRKITSLQTEIKEVAYFQAIGCQDTQLTVDTCQSSFYLSGQATQASFDSCGTVILDDSDLTEASFDSCGLVQATYADITSGMADSVSLLLTSEAKAFICNDSTVIDEKSKGLILNGCNAFLRDSDAIAVDSLCNAYGGKLLASGNMLVNTTGADVINADGLTVGTGFTPELQAGSLSHDGIDTKLQCTIGNVVIESLIGNVITLAGVSITELAGVAIIETAGTQILSTATTAVTITAGTSLSANAGTNAQITAPAGNMIVQGSTTSIVGNTILTVSAPSVQIAGNVDFY